MAVLTFFVRFCRILLVEPYMVKKVFFFKGLVFFVFHIKNKGLMFLRELSRYFGIKDALKISSNFAAEC